MRKPVDNALTNMSNPIVAPRGGRRRDGATEASRAAGLPPVIRAMSATGRDRRKAIVPPARPRSPTPGAGASAHEVADPLHAARLGRNGQPFEDLADHARAFQRKGGVELDQ